MTADRGFGTDEYKSKVYDDVIRDTGMGNIAKHVQRGENPIFNHTEFIIYTRRQCLKDWFLFVINNDLNCCP